MPEFINLWSAILTSLSTFLMTEPIVYIVGFVILGFIAGFLKKLLTV